MSCIFSEIWTYWLKIVPFSTFLYSTPLRGGVRKYNFGLPGYRKFDDMFSRFYANAIDVRTDKVYTNQNA